MLACIVAGIMLGEVAPAVFRDIAAPEVARVNIPAGLLIWVMIVPMLLKVDCRQSQQGWGRQTCAPARSTLNSSDLN